MAGNKTGIKNMGSGSAPGVVRTLLAIIGIGFAGSAALVGAAKTLGEKLEEKQVRDYEKLEAQREADKENVRRIMENAVEAEYDTDENTSER